MTRIAWYTAVVLFTLTMLFLVWQFRMAVVFFLLAVALSAAFRRAIDYLIQRNFSYLLAIALVYGVFIVLFLTLGFAFYGPLIGELDRGTNELINGYAVIKETWLEGKDPFQRNVAALLPPSDELFKEMVVDSPELASSVLGFAMNFLEFGGKVAIVLVLSIYWNVEYIRIERFWLSLLPFDWRARIRAIWRDIEEGISLYISSEALQSFAAFILLWLGYLVLGYKFPVLLALGGVLLRFVPWLGPLLALLLVGVSGLNGSPWIVILGSVYTLVILYGLKIVAERHFRPTHRISLLLVVMVMIVLLQVIGVVGIILASPLAAVIQILAAHLLEIQTDAKDRWDDSTISALRGRMQVVDSILSNQPEPAPPEVTHLVGRLKELIERSLPADRESRSA